MESITVYQKIPHPGIQANLSSYYSKQVGAVSGESSGGVGRWGQVVRPGHPAWFPLPAV